MQTQLSITFSPHHLLHLGLDVQQALTVALSLGFKRIRLGVYWDKVEQKTGEYDFSEIISLLNKCESAEQKVVLTVGVKAPRWPEFYWPTHVQEKNPIDIDTQTKILSLVKKTITHLNKFSCITHWQVENEPLDPSGPSNLAIPIKFLQQEVKLVKSLDQRPIVINLWGNELVSRGFFQVVEPLTDIIGLDLYYKQYLGQIVGQSIYVRPRQSDRQLADLINASSKPVWITELQAEPWEKDDAGYKSNNPKSISPELLVKNYQRARKLCVDEIILWGFEYWLWRQSQGDTRYIDVVKSLK